MSRLRFHVANVVARILKIVLKAMGRNATHFPGSIALKIDPDFLRHVGKPRQIIAITGTNGKTTVSNLLSDVLRAQGLNVVNNALGSNIVPGIVSTLVDATNIIGKSKVDCAVLEVDERASIHIFPHIKPDIIAITNLSRDSYKRNAHVDYIISILNRSIPDSSHLILNSDDLFVSGLKPNNSRTYYGIAPQLGEPEVRDSIINDLDGCPNCGGPLIADFVRYHHIGRYHCAACGFESPQPDVLVDEIDSENHQLVVSTPKQTKSVRLIGPKLTDAYNELTVIAVMDKLGTSLYELDDILSNMKLVQSRHNEMTIGNKMVIGLLAKDQNPVANSRICDYVRSQTEWGNVAILLANEMHSHLPERKEVANTAWIYDVDVEYLNQDFIKQIVIGGHTRYDYQIRLLLAGIPHEKITMVDTVDEEVGAFDPSLDTIVLFYDTDNLVHARRMLEGIAHRLQKEVAHEDRVLVH